MSVIVIGSGVNELVAAHYLARAGCQVLVLTGRAESVHVLFECGWVPPRIVTDLRLAGRGLKLGVDDPWAAVPLAGGGRLELWRDPIRSVESIRRLNPGDAAKWPAFCERMARLATVLERMYLTPPPDPVSRTFGDVAQLAVLGMRIRGMGRQGVEDLVRLVPISVADFLDEWFENDALKGMLAGAGIMHLCQGPRSGGTALRLLHHHVGSRPGVFRQPCSNMRRVLTEMPGIEIRRGAEVSRICVRDARVTGVLVGAEEIPATTIVSGADPRHTLTSLVDPAWMDPALARAVRNIRCRGVTARVSLTLDRPPGVPALAVAPALDYLERAYDDAKYGAISRAPYVEARSAGAAAADGRYRVDALVQYAPHAPADGEWNDGRRTALGERVVKLLAEHDPAFGSAAVARVMTPVDLERECGFPEGQEHHAELTLDQMLWMRPVPELARYRTPVAGLYLCGPAMHPGGGIVGACGYNAAREILRDLKNS